MKKWIAVFSLVAIVFQFFSANTVQAAESQYSVASSYCIDNIWYCFVNSSNQTSSGDTNVRPVIGNNAGEGQKLSTQYQDNENTVDYLMLIDLSTSMKYYRNEINAFAASLIDDEHQNVSITVASFGESFNVISENITDFNELNTVLKNLKYTQKATDICSGISNALQYLSDCQIKKGELTNLILMTDGVPYFSNKDDENIINLQDLEKIKNQILETPEIIAHTIEFKKWDDDIHNSLSSGKGLNFAVGNANDAEQAGKSIINFINNLYVVEFPITLDINKFDGQLIFTSEGNENNTIISVNNVKNFSFDSSDITETTSNNKTGPAANETNTYSETTESITIDNPVDNEEKNTDKNNLLYIMLSIAGLAIVVLFIVIIYKAKAKKSLSNQVRLKIEVISTEYKCNTDEVILKDQILIGRSSHCNIVFSDDSLSKKNTRIFLKDGLVYIEDLNDNSNTELEGMKIHSANRLYPGNRVKIGNICFYVKF